MKISITSDTIFRTIVLLILFYVLYLIRDIVLLVLASVVIASSIEPLILWLGLRKINRLISVIATYVALGVAFVGIFYFFVPSLLSDTASFLGSLPQYIDTISIDGAPLTEPRQVAEKISENISQSKQVVEGFSGSSFRDILVNLSHSVSTLSSGFVRTIGAVFGGVLGFVLIVVLSFYLAVQEDGVAKFLKVITPLKHEQYTINLWKRVQHKIGRWMQGQLLLALIVGVMAYLGLTIFGVKNALFLAAIAAVFEAIPLFGPILAAIPAVASAYVQGGLQTGLLILGLYLIIQQFENQLVYPLVVKKIVGVPPIIVILALIVGAKLGGFLGVVLSVPVAATLVEYLDDLQKDKISQTQV